MSKLSLYGLIALLLLISATYIYKDASIVLEKSTDKPYVSQKNNTVIGYDQGKKVFQININKVLQETYQHVLFAKKITDGTVFNNDGKKVIAQLKGDGARINTNIKSITVTENISALITPSKESIKVTAKKFNYNHLKRIAKFYGSAELILKDIQILTKDFTYSSINDTLVFDKGFELIKKHSQTSANEGTLNINESTLTATKNILTTYTGKASSNNSDQMKALLQNQTIITSKKLHINFKDNDFSIIAYRDNVNARQPGKYLSSNHLELDFKHDRYMASGAVQFEFDDLQWLLKKGKPIQNSDFKKLIKVKTTITAEISEFTPTNNVFRMKENVVIKQRNLKLQCDDFTYDIGNEKIIMTGKVIIKKYGVETLNSTKLVIDVKNETFRTDSTEEMSEIILDLNE